MQEHGDGGVDVDVNVDSMVVEAGDDERGQGDCGVDDSLDDVESHTYTGQVEGVDDALMDK